MLFGYLGVSVWFVLKFVLNLYKLPQLGIVRRAAPHRVVKRACSCVTYVRFEPLHSSLMQLRNELQQRMHDRRLRDTNTHTMSTRASQHWVYRRVSYLSLFTHSTCFRQNRTRKMFSKAAFCEHFKELGRMRQGRQ